MSRSRHLIMASEFTTPGAVMEALQLHKCKVVSDRNLSSLPPT